MKLSAALLTIVGAQAFAPTRYGARVSTTRSFGLVDPSMFHDLPHQVDTLRETLSTIILSDLDAAGDAVSTASDAVSAVAPDALSADAVSAVAPDAAVSAVADTAADAAADTTYAAASTSTTGPFGFLTLPIESLLQIIHSVLVAVGLSSNSWGISIIFMTLTIKLLTFPLTKTQLESTNKMQQLQPEIKQLQSKYESNPEVMNQKIAELYQSNEVNPLAGCLPSIVQIPVFIGLYRAVLTLAKEDKLNEPFLWMPNLEGPTYGADPSHGTDWILQGWVDGVPSMGWEDTTAFLILPALLVVSQFASMQLMQPDSEEARAQQPFILKLLPLMIGWFSLNVPAALCVYWFCNNLVTTASTLYIKSTMAPVQSSGGGTATATPEVSVFSPPTREKPSGFAASSFSDSGVTPITPVDAEIIDVSNDDDEDEIEEPTGMGESTPKPKKRGGKKKRKKRKN